MSQPESALDELVSGAAWRPDWNEVLVRGGMTSSRRALRRRLIVAAVFAAAVLAPLAALADVNDWWFFRTPGGPAPTSAPVVVTTGVWDGHPWQLVAYPSETDGLCFSMVPGNSQSADSYGAGMGCAPFEGVSRTPRSKMTPNMTITFLSGSPSAVLPAYIAGPVVEQATTVEIRFDDGRTITTATLAGPAPLEHVRFYAVQLHHGAAQVRTLRAPTAGTRLEWLAGLDANGKVVACLDPATATNGISPLSACR